MKLFILIVLVNFMCKLNGVRDAQIAVKTFLRVSACFQKRVPLEYVNWVKKFPLPMQMYFNSGTEYNENAEGHICMCIHWYIQFLLPLDIIVPGSQAFRQRLTPLPPPDSQVFMFELEVQHLLYWVFSLQTAELGTTIVTWANHT